MSTLITIIGSSIIILTLAVIYSHFADKYYSQQIHNLFQDNLQQIAKIRQQLDKLHKEIKDL